MSAKGIIQRISPDRRSFALDVFRIAGLALVYFFAHCIAFFFPDSEKVIMLVWPAGGVGLAAFLLNPRRLWPALALAFCIAGIAADVLLADRSLMTGVGYMAGNMIESIGCAWLILYWAKDFRNFTRIKEILPLIAGAVFVNAFSSCIGAATSVLTRGTSFIESWQSWYIADGLGILLVGPFIVAWIGVKETIVGMRLTKTIEGVAFVAIWSLLSLLVLRPHEIKDQVVFQPYILTPLLAWAAIRLGQRGVTLALVLLLAIAIVSPAIVNGPSPWARSDGGLRGRLLDLQQFLGFMAVIGYLMAASHADRKGTEQALRASEAYYRTLFESANDAILIVKDNVFSDCNAAATRLAGRSRQELLGHSPATFSPARQPDGRDSREMAGEKIQAVLEGNPQFFAWMLLRADGSPIFTEVSLSRIESVSEPTFLAIVRDITRQKRGEEALLQSEKARAEAEKLAATGRMAARIAHEINNPLAGIRNAIRLFRDVIPKDCPEHAFVERTDKEIERLARTVRLMYDLHRPNQERKSDVLLEETFQDVVLLLEPLVPAICGARGNRTAGAESPRPYSRGGNAASPLHSCGKRHRSFAAGRSGPSWDGRGP